MAENPISSRPCWAYTRHCTGRRFAPTVSAIVPRTPPAAVSGEWRVDYVERIASGCAGEQYVKEILGVLKGGFGRVEWGDQGTEDDPDAYFWVKRGGVRVAVDNFTSLEFQVKCSSSDTLLIQEVVDVLAGSFGVKVYDEPELEAHE